MLVQRPRCYPLVKRISSYLLGCITSLFVVFVADTSDDDEGVNRATQLAPAPPGGLIPGRIRLGDSLHQCKQVSPAAQATYILGNF